MQESLITGIVSGLLTSFLLFLGAAVWRKQISPWIENLLYRDAHIEGTWTGILIPYLGLEELDKLRKKHAWEMFKRMSIARRKKSVKNDKEVDTSNSENIIPYKDSEGEVIGDVIIPEKTRKEHDSATETPPSESKISFAVAIKPVPIGIKVELDREGHNIVGRVIEVGGASSLCSYTLKVQFRNLILACIYETESKEDIDRGSCSLMLKNNGKNLEGFFSSYSDHEHLISPMHCILRKQNHFDPETNE